MMPQIEVSVDLETMGNGPDAAIIAVGAVEFSLETGQLDQEFYEVVDLESSVAAGGTITPSTILWWMQQSDAARKVFERKGEHIETTLCHFTGWLYALNGVRNVCLWGNGAAFDNVILRSAYERLGLKAPWHFWSDRCFRTVKALHPAPEGFENLGTDHNALDDAKNQARYLIEVLKR